MKRIMIIGGCGAGKSTLSRKLAELTGLPLIHMDQLFWKPNWEETGKVEFAKIVKETAKKEKWIIDGNYSSTIDLRLERADTVIALFRPTWVYLFRVFKRIIQNYGKTREDMTPGCPERFDLEFIHFILFFNLTRKPSLLKKLKRLDDSKKVYILKSDKEVEAYLLSLSNN